MAWSRLRSGDNRDGSAAACLRLKPRLNSGWGLSLDNPRGRLPGGGGKKGAAVWSGEGRWTTAGDIRLAGDKLGEGSCGEAPAGRLLRGGEYGGGPGAAQITLVYDIDVEGAYIYRLGHRIDLENI